MTIRVVVCGYALLCAVILARAEERDEFSELCLVVGYDQSEACKRMFPVLAEMRDAGYNIVYVDLKKPEVRKYLAAFELDKDGRMPCYLMFVGHESFEKCTGPMTIKSLSEWFFRARKGQSSPRTVKPIQQREYLQNNPENTVYLRRRLSPPTCGMAWCMAHRYEILEYVDAQGRVVGKGNR
jgi:hypothetical protein